ncbi:dihydrolipoyllysine-residue succinyltransferase component of 2-oxoglutarate dehydrogenase complex [Mycobacterium sp. MAC_080597_8934]|nr:dihydrolipoyllysine-residue succinyltransferase component of 2-oxoglutarate dehydrogenase complex [Mycobacterium sp. MAC_080597_8934]
MAFSVQMPALGESVTEGTVTRWLKQEGDTVELDEPLVEVSTDKVDTEIPSPAAGVLTKIIAQEDDTVEVGGELAVIGDAADDGAAGGGAQAPSQPSQPQAPAQPESQAQEPAQAQPEAPAQPQAPAQPAPQESGGGAATPVLMPELGESVTEGTVTRWLKKVGDSVQVDDALVEVSTDKVDTEIPSPVAGVLISITAEEDSTVPVGGELARIGTGAQAPAPAAPQPPPAPKPEPKPEPAPQPRRSPRHSPSRKPAGARAESPTGASPTGSSPAGRRRRGHPLRDTAGAKAGRREQHRPVVDHRHRGGRSHPQARRPGRRRAEAAATTGRRPAVGRTGPRGRRGPQARRADPGAGAGASARHHPEGQPDPSDHRGQDARIPACHSPTHPDP